MKQLIKLVKNKNINTLNKFMNDEDVCRIIEGWHTLAEDECGETIDYEYYLVECYQEMLNNI